jgi:FAD synthase
VRSSDVRSAISAGDLVTAELLLGRPVTIVASVDGPIDGGPVPLTFPWPMALPPDGRYPCTVERQPATMAIRDGSVLLEGPVVAPGRVLLTLSA